MPDFYGRFLLHTKAVAASACTNTYVVRCLSSQTRMDFSDLEDVTKGLLANTPRMQSLADSAYNRLVRAPPPPPPPPAGSPPRGGGGGGPGVGGFGMEEGKLIAPGLPWSHRN